MHPLRLNISILISFNQFYLTIVIFIQYITSPLYQPPYNKEQTTLVNTFFFKQHTHYLFSLTNFFHLTSHYNLIHTSNFIRILIQFPILYFSIIERIAVFGWYFYWMTECWMSKINHGFYWLPNAISPLLMMTKWRADNEKMIIAEIRGRIIINTRIEFQRYLIQFFFYCMIINMFLLSVCVCVHILYILFGWWWANSLRPDLPFKKLQL